jgi:hypothetical protein
VRLLPRLGAEVRLVAVEPGDLCDCISQALWLRNLGYQDPTIREEDLMMISESDVFISTGRVVEPLRNLAYRSWH